MQNIIIVGLGGFAGSVLRYRISGWVQSISENPPFPYGTLGVNVLGCLHLFLGIATLEEVDIHFCRAGRQDPSASAPPERTP